VESILGGGGSGTGKLTEKCCSTAVHIGGEETPVSSQIRG
jgi:hypothetical protein